MWSKATTSSCYGHMYALACAKNLIKELDTKTTGVLRNMFKHNPPSAQPTYKDKKADLIYKRLFCDFI